MTSSVLELASVSVNLWERYLRSPGRVQLPSTLRRCWDRVRGLGAMPQGPGHDAVVGSLVLRERQQRLAELLTLLPNVLSPAIRVLSQHEHVLVLADSDGVVLHTAGGGAFAETAKQVRLIEGSDWSEGLRGTNAIGTALAELRPVTVCGTAHFAQPNHRITCHAAPIYDPFGELLAILNATSSAESSAVLVDVTVQAFARSIEQSLRQQAMSRLGSVERALIGRIMADYPNPAVLIGQNGCIERANPAARETFECVRERYDSGWHSATSNQQGCLGLLGLRWQQLCDRIRGGQTRWLTDNRSFRVELEPVVDAKGRILMIAAFFEAYRPPALSVGSKSDSFASYFGKDPVVCDLRAKARTLAKTDLPVLLLGETGTGKGILARCIHDDSDRSTGPFVALNCGAIGAELLASELFGYAPGAFTGANNKGSVGRLPSADGGTLFLDEIAEMSPEVQVLLLRFLDDGSYRRVGDSTVYHADVRILCATCRPLPQLVADGQFRADVFYRIQGATLNLPPLRQRNDVMELSRYLLASMGEQKDHRRVKALSPDCDRELTSRSWPGNVRQLKSALQYALAMSSGASQLSPEHFPEQPNIPYTAKLNTTASEGGHNHSTYRGKASLKTIELAALRGALRNSNGNVSATARELGVARSTIYRMMKKHGLKAQ